VLRRRLKLLTLHNITCFRFFENMCELVCLHLRSCCPQKACLQPLSTQIKYPVHFWSISQGSQWRKPLQMITRLMSLWQRYHQASRQMLKYAEIEQWSACSLHDTCIKFFLLSLAWFQCQAINTVNEYIQFYNNIWQYIAVDLILMAIRPPGQVGSPSNISHRRLPRVSRTCESESWKWKRSSCKQQHFSRF
jgi:hypothetical protein